MGERNMNSTKTNLIKSSGILSIIGGFFTLVMSVLSVFNTDYLGRVISGYGYVSYSAGYAISITLCVLEILLGICSMLGGLFLIKFLLPKYQNSTKRIKYYKWGCGLTIAGALGLSLATILLYISFGMKETTANAYFNDSEVNSIQSNPATNAQQQQQDENIKKQIEILRDMKAKGEITDEEFKTIMFDIIKKS